MNTVTIPEKRFLELIEIENKYINTNKSAMVWWIKLDPNYRPSVQYTTGTTTLLNN